MAKYKAQEEEEKYQKQFMQSCPVPRSCSSRPDRKSQNHNEAARQSQFIRPSIRPPVQSKSSPGSPIRPTSRFVQPEHMKYTLFSASAVRRVVVVPVTGNMDKGSKGKNREKRLRAMTMLKRENERRPSQKEPAV